MVPGTGHAIRCESSLSEVEEGFGDGVVVVEGPGVHQGLGVIEIALSLNLCRKVESNPLSHGSLNNSLTGL